MAEDVCTEEDAAGAEGEGETTAEGNEGTDDAEPEADGLVALEVIGSLTGSEAVNAGSCSVDSLEDGEAREPWAGVG